MSYRRQNKKYTQILKNVQHGMEIIFNFVWIMFNFLMLHVDCVQLAKSLGKFNYVRLCSTEFDCRLFDSRTMLGLLDLFSILLQIKVMVILMTLRCQAIHSFLLMQFIASTRIAKKQTNMPLIQRSFDLLNACIFCAIFRHYWMQCIRSFSLSLQIKEC